jgi:hypothetical protein
MGLEEMIMAEVSKMTDQQLNRALAELMGYRVERYEVTPFKGGRFKLLKDGQQVSPEGCFTEDSALMFAPYYCTDPAASLEVQAAAIAKDAEGYIRNLSIIQSGPDPKVEDMVAIDLILAARMCNATHRQRAQAAFLTLKE